MKIYRNLRNPFIIPFLFLLCFSLPVLAAPGHTAGPVTGQVVDENGVPLVGATVQLKGSNVVTTTDAAGNFTINVPDKKATLVITHVGFDKFEVAASDHLIIRLRNSTASLGDVVVIGYGTQKKVSVTGSVDKLSGAKTVDGRAALNTTQLLQGESPNLIIQQRGFVPNGGSFNINIRGTGTTGNNNPLIVIDGVIGGDMNTLNPNDIDNISVLKDAGSAAIYGSRSANGVIIVTTKRGKEGKAAVTYDAYVGTGQAWKKLDVLNNSQYIAMQSQLGPDRDFSSFANKPEVDWQKVVFRNSHVQSHNIGINGGNATANYFVGAGYMNQQGIEPAQAFKRYSIKANADIKVGKFLRFGESLLMSSFDRNVQSEEATFAAAQAARNQPFFQVYDPTNPTGYNLETSANRGPAGGSSNLMMRTNPKYTYTTVVSRKVLGNVYAEAEIIKGLRYRISGGFDYNVGDGHYYGGPVGYNGFPQPSFLVQERPIELTTNVNNTLTFNKTIGKHSFTILAGHEETNFRYDKVRVQGSDLFNPAIQFASTGVQVGAANEADHWALRGYLGRVNYSYNDKYLFTFNVRQDNSSRFSKAHRSGTFPSFSAGWRLSQESFFPKGSIFDDVKIRASWGQSGNQFTGTNFAYISTLHPFINYVVGTGTQTVVRGPAPIVFANPDLKWETSTQTDIGADISMFQGKIDLTFDYYHKVTNNILLPFPAPYTSGFFLPIDANLGKMLNRGIELALNYKNKVGRLKYGIGGNITTVHNEVLDLGGIPEIISGVGGAATHRSVVGQPIGSFFGYKTDGIFQNQAEVDAAVPDNTSNGRAPGDIRYVDVNKDGKIDPQDRTNLGSPIPKFFYGITLSASYKNFDFSVLLQGVSGQKVYNQLRASMEDLRSSNNFRTSTLSHWTGEGTSTTMPRLTVNDDNNNNRYSDRWIESASFMRIRNLQIGYNIPSEKLKDLTKGAISRFRIYVAAQNLMTFTKYSGFDPEVTRGFSFQKGETPLSNGQDSGSSPQPRILQFGWSVTF